MMGDSWVIPSTIHRQGRDTTDWEEKTMGDSWVIPTTIPALPCPAL